MRRYPEKHRFGDEAARQGSMEARKGEKRVRFNAETLRARREERRERRDEHRSPGELLHQVVDVRSTDRSVGTTGDEMKRAIVGLVMMVMGAGLIGQARGEVKSASARKFRIEQELMLAASPNEVYDAVTGDISRWWDHSFSGHPKKLYIEARPGGGFYEIFDDAGNGALHATVIYADRGKKLRYAGPLGFSGRAIDMVTTYDLTADGTGTRFHVTVAAVGEVDEQLAAAVDGVWHHFLDERWKVYIASGEYKNHAAGGGGGSETMQHDANPLMRGKVKAEKTIRLEKMVNASPDELFQLWTTDVGVRAFFAPAARIDPKVGGAYTIIFNPAADPNGDSFGTNGARILEFQRPGKLSFEWITFTDVAKPVAGGPPAIAASVRNARPIPTWVEIEFAVVPGDTMKTDVKLAHYGFKSGAEWDAAFNYSKGVWAGVLDKLAKWAELPRVAQDNSAMKGTTRDLAPDSADGMMTGGAVHTTIADVAFFSGRWTGTAAPARGEMSCMYRAMSAEKVGGLDAGILVSTLEAVGMYKRGRSSELIGGN